MKLYFLKNRKKIIPIFLIFLSIIVFLFFPQFVYAWTGVAKVLGWIMYPFIWLMGKLAILLLNILIGVAQYNDFIHSSAVTYGWIIVRDLCNMFFVLILLIIAFATILQVESYNLRTWLPKLVIMAILINFSKLICGVFIDFAQVVMLTFINAVKDIAGGNLTEMLGLTKILSADANAPEVTAMTIIGSMILALILVIVAVVVILAMLIMLVMRIVMIWIYVVLSPLAYLLASFPQGQSYSQRWWSDFSKNLIIGPVIAFFLWLSFASLGGVESSKDIEAMKAKKEFAEGLEAGSEGPTESITLSEAGSQEHMIKFVISIGMLLGGLMIAQEIGGMAGKVAGKGMARLQAMGTGAIKMGKRATRIQRVQDAYKVRQSMKETRRGERAQRDAGWATEKIGQVKRGAMAPVNYLGRQTGQAVKRVFRASQKTIDAKKQGIENDKKSRIELEDLNVKIEDARSGAQNIQNLEAEKQRVNNDLNNNVISKDEADQKTKDIDNRINSARTSQQNKEQEVVEDYKKITGNKDVNSLSDIKRDDIEKQILAKEQSITKGEKNLEGKMKKSKIIGKSINIVGGLATLGLKGKVQHAGEADLEMASNHNSGQINKHKDNMKDYNEDELRKEMNNHSLFNGHKRAAATMTLMEKGKLTQEEARIKRNDINKGYGYDNKVANQLDSALAGNYQNLTQSFSELHTTSAPKDGPDNRPADIKEKHQKAQEKIVRGIVGGSIDLKNIDKQSMELIMPGLVKTMSNKNFKSKYDDLTKDKQKDVVSSLKKSGDYDSLKKLTTVQDVNISNFSTNEDKIKFLGEVEIDDVGKMVSKEDSINSLKELLEASNDSLISEIKNSNSKEDLTENLNKLFKNSHLNTAISMQRAIVDSFEKILNKNFSKLSNAKAGPTGAKTGTGNEPYNRQGKIGFKS